MADAVTAAPGISPLHRSGNGIKARFPITLCGKGSQPPHPALDGAFAVFTYTSR